MESVRASEMGRCGFGLPKKGRSRDIGQRVQNPFLD